MNLVQVLIQILKDRSNNYQQRMKGDEVTGKIDNI